MSNVWLSPLCASDSPESPASYAMILSSLTLSKTHLHYGRRVDLALFKVTVVDLTLVLCLCSFLALSNLLAEPGPNQMISCIWCQYQ